MKNTIGIICRKDIDKKKLEDLLVFILKYVQPIKSSAIHYNSGRTRRYKMDKMVEALRTEIDIPDERIEFRMEWEEEYNGCLKIGKVKANYPIYIDLVYMENIQQEVIEVIEQFIVKEAVMAYKRNVTDFSIQTTKQIDILTDYYGENVNEYPICNGIWGEEIDVEKNPGYGYYVKGYELGAFYRMWFGKEAYEFLDKEALRSFPCYENVVLDNDVTRITLYENILDYKKKENREKQWEFRRALHIDEIAHRMMEEEKEEQRRNADPELKILQGHFEHGGIRIFQTFLKDGKNVRRSQADSVEEVEYDKDGKVVFRTIREI